MRALESRSEVCAEDRVGGAPTAASPLGSALGQDSSLEETRQAAMGRHEGAKERPSRPFGEIKTEHVDKSALTIAEPRRYPSKSIPGEAQACSYVTKAIRSPPSRFSKPRAPAEK
jgi:hypothetical protein